MKSKKLIFVLLCVFAFSIFIAEADPCNTNFGGCDVLNGLCWGTGNTTHYCVCKAGYEENKTSVTHQCQDVDECSENPCGDNANCKNTDGSYTCTCLCGYVMDYTGQKCLNAFEITGICYLPKECHHEDWPFLGSVPFDPFFALAGFVPDPYGGYDVLPQPTVDNVCECEEGFVKNHCGYCVDYDECALGIDTCNSENGTCTNTEGSYFCGCKGGFILGPCRKKCYPVGSTIPVLCSNPDLSSLNSSGSVNSSALTFLRPFQLKNWRTCATNVSVGQITVVHYDVDQDGKNDVRLTFACINRFIVENVSMSTSLLNHYAEDEATWTAWSCWSACKATCWGGVQTRVRKCVHGRPGLAGCTNHGSEKRECYTGPKCAYRIRKDVSKLTQAEIDDLLQAMEKYKNDTSVKGFHSAAAAHGWPFQCNKRQCCPHGAKMRFITWHRSIMLNYEEGLSRYMINKTLGIPYWNWLSPNQAPPDIVWSKNMSGRPNPFSNATVLIDRSGPMRSIQRADVADVSNLIAALGNWRDVTSKLIKPYLMHEFSESLETAHNEPHVAVCPFDSSYCTVSMAQLAFAGFDPVFMFHHSQVDRLWAVEQKMLEDAKNMTWTKQTALEALDEEAEFGRRFMPFGNKTLNAFPIVQATNTMHDSFYYRELTGIKYDYLGNKGFPPIAQATVGLRALTISRPPRRGGVEYLFAAQYFKNVEMNTYINYYINFENLPCENLTLNEYSASTLLLATNNPYRNAIPNLVLLSNANEFAQSLASNLPVTECYTSVPNCRSRCPELSMASLRTMPSVNLVHYLRNQPVDIFKFTWSLGKRMPQWNINFDGSSQWIHFFGDRIENIVQVPTSFDWQACNSVRGRPFQCTRENACVLPVGIYYLIDNGVTECQSGLRMIITSRK